MKIEIDLDTIFRDEEGEPGESIEEAVRRQVTDRLTGDLRKHLFARLDHQLSEVTRDQIGAVVKEKMPALMDAILSAAYVPVSNYGQRAEPTTFRNEVIRLCGELTGSMAAHLACAGSAAEPGSLDGGDDGE